jgi:UDP-N-acetylmuramoyl-tripeptide--D-alanyl-D-alanine ligase
MKEFSISALSRIIKSAPTKNTGSFTGVSTDSRTIKPDDCFFAIAGDNFDGHNYLTEVFDKGAVCAVVSKDVTGDKILRVGDTIKALGDFAREYRRRMNFKVVAITGSTGKTSTRRIISHVLGQRHRVFEAPKNFNNDIGLPLTLLGAEPEDEIIIAELGSSFPGEIAYLTGIALPDIAVITNVYIAHLAGFGTLETIAEEKLSISQGLSSDGVLIINADTVPRATGHGPRVITFGKSTDCDIQAQNINYKGLGSSFTIDGTEIKVPLPGAGNVENTLAAWAVCSRFAVTIDDFAQAVGTLPAVAMRAEPLQIGTLTVLSDCYNANPASMKNALDILANLGATEKRRLVFICGDMAELGQASEQLHAELGTAIAQARVRLLITVGNFAKIAAGSAKSSARHELQTESFEDTLSACNNLEKFIKDYDIILVKGSRTAGLEMVVKRLKKLFS